MSRSSKSQGVLLSATAGFTIMLNLVLPSYVNADQETIAIISPLISGASLFVLDWIIAWFGIESAREMRVKKAIQKRIDSLHKNIDRHKEVGLCTKELESELSKAVVAQSKQDDAFRKDLYNN